MPRFALRSKRVEQMICANDLFIAVHARSLKVTLVTNNTGEFGRVQDLDIENWAE
jgi:tRNA(fMet)-specific endonuclease VapC